MLQASFRWVALHLAQLSLKEDGFLVGEREGALPSIRGTLVRGKAVCLEKDPCPVLSPELEYLNSDLSKVTAQACSSVGPLADHCLGLKPKFMM